MTTAAIALPWYRGVPKRVGWAVLLGLAVLLFLLASRYLVFGEAVYFPEQKATYVAHTAGIVTHIAGAMVATLLGPFQFLPRISTNRYVRLHRWLGRAYPGGVLVGGLGGLYMAFLAYGGLPARLGSGCSRSPGS